MRYRIMLLTGVLAMTVPLVYGQTTTDPATLHLGFGGPGTTSPCAIGCNGGDPNVSNGATSSVDIYQTNDTQSRTIPSGQLLLILAVPNDTTNLSLSVSSETDYNPYTAAGKMGSVSATSYFMSGFNSMFKGDLYSFLGLSGGDASNSFNNFTTMDAAGNTPSVDLTATSFGVYEFVVNSDLGANGLANIVFSSDLPLGTYVAAYGCQGTTATGPTGTTSTTNLNCGSANPNPFVNAFTEAGLVDAPPTTTPEPTAVILLGSSMIGIGALVRRRRSRLPKLV